MEASVAPRGVALDDFRETLSHVPSPVTIVTTLAEGRAHATTVSAFTSLSAEPPLVLVALDRKSDLLDARSQDGRTRRGAEQGRGQALVGELATGGRAAAHRECRRLALL